MNLGAQLTGEELNWNATPCLQSSITVTVTYKHAPSECMCLLPLAWRRPPCLAASLRQGSGLQADGCLPCVPQLALLKPRRLAHTSWIMCAA